MGKNRKTGTEVPAGDQQQIDLADLPAMSDEALKQLAIDNGIELWDGYDREGLIKAITELVDGGAEGPGTDSDKTDTSEKSDEQQGNPPPKTDSAGSGEKGNEQQGNPPPPDNSNANGKQGDPGGGVEVISTKRAGKTITAVTGKPITFDKDGKATVHPRDAEYLNTCPGFGK
ncbi:MAG: hypothetical protein LBB72_01515 [Spirochaetaceae bacterium]|jgi:cobalamin biosynthesis protein CobT|nr:hypothetical protein [Spirochaetaceae bacterium]